MSDNQATKDRDKVFEILEANSDKNFVERIFSPEKSPSIINEDGSASTHRMATSEAEGVHYVYPTIIMHEDGYLRENSEDTAFDEAVSRGEAIGFKTAKEAEWFEKHWKLMWDLNHKADY